jgi:hypothetical protein
MEDEVRDVVQEVCPSTLFFLGGGRC